ncbi:MAG: hypothetical protein ACOY40_00895 [Bacillota bacterium]
MLKRIWLFMTGIMLTIAVALGVFLGTGLMAGPMARPVFSVFGQDGVKGISPGAILREENCYLCGDVELVYQGPAPADMLGRDLKALGGKYPEKDGWTVEIKNEKLVVLRKNVNGFCGEHSLYRHLGIYRDRLAVYQGPLGFDQRLLRVEGKKKVGNLPPALREKLQKAAEYHRLTAQEKSALRSELEFIDETALNSALENLDEITGE